MKLTLFQTFAMPLLLCLCTLAGLCIGVAIDGWTDWLAIAALSLPLMIIGKLLWRRAK